MSPVAAKRSRATATPMIPPIKWAGMMTRTLAVRPSRLSATRTGKFGARRGMNEAAAAALALRGCLEPLPRARRRRLVLPPLLPPPWRRNHCGVVWWCECVGVV